MALFRQIVYLWLWLGVVSGNNTDNYYQYDDDNEDNYGHSSAWLRRPDQLYTPNEHDNLLIECEFISTGNSSSSPLSIVWRKNNLILAVNRIINDLNNKNYRIIVAPSTSHTIQQLLQPSQAASLLIANITATDSAVYTCSLTNDYGQVLLHANATVNVTVLPKYARLMIDDHNSLDDIRVEINRTVQIKCCIESDVNPLPEQVELYLNGDLVSNKGHWDDRHLTASNRSMVCFGFDFQFYFNYLYNDQVFACTIRNATNAKLIEHPVRINIHYPPKVNLIAIADTDNNGNGIIVNGTSSSVQINENSNLKLNCQINTNHGPDTANTMLKTKWFFNDTLIYETDSPIAASNINHQYLDIDKVNSKQAGYYRCHVHNGHGSNESNRIYVNVLYAHLNARHDGIPSAPAVTTSTSTNDTIDLYMNEGADLNMYCSLDTNMATNKSSVLKWSFNGIEMSNAANIGAIRLTGLTHKVNNGIYKCFVHGTHLFVDFNVNIHYGPKIEFNTSASNNLGVLFMAPDDDQLIAINCHVDAKPAHYDIKWLLNDTQVLSTNQNVLHIQRQRASIFGKYTCLATNSISTQNKSIYLTEMRRPDVPFGFAFAKNKSTSLLQWSDGLNGGDQHTSNMLTINDKVDLKLVSCLFGCPPTWNQSDEPLTTSSATTATTASTKTTLVQLKNINPNKTYAFKLKAQNRYGSSAVASVNVSASNQSNIMTIVNRQPSGPVPMRPMITISAYYKLNSQYICIYTSNNNNNNNKNDDDLMMPFYLQLNIWNAKWSDAMHYQVNLVNNKMHSLSQLNTCLSFADFRLAVRSQQAQYVIDLDKIDHTEPLQQSANSQTNKAEWFVGSWDEVNSFDTFKKSLFSINITLCSHTATYDVCFSNSTWTVADDYFILFNERISLTMITVCSVISVLLILMSVLFCICHYYLNEKQKKHMINTKTDPDPVGDSTPAPQFTTTHAFPMSTTTTKIKYTSSLLLYQKRDADDDEDHRSSPESGYSTPKKRFYEVFV